MTETINLQVGMGYRLTVTAELIPDEEEGGYVVYCPELDIHTQGDTIEDAIANLQEAAIGYIEVVGIENLSLRPRPAIRKDVELTIYA